MLLDNMYASQQNDIIKAARRRQRTAAKCAFYNNATSTMVSAGVSRSTLKGGLIMVAVVRSLNSLPTNVILKYILWIAADTGFSNKAEMLNTDDVTWFSSNNKQLHTGSRDSQCCCVRGGHSPPFMVTEKSSLREIQKDFPPTSVAQTRVCSLSDRVSQCSNAEPQFLLWKLHEPLSSCRHDPRLPDRGLSTPLQIFYEARSINMIP